MEATCSVILCDAGYRILWMSSCPAGYPLAEVLGKRPWDFLAGEHAVNFQAAMCRAVSEQAPQQLDFASEHIGAWRAWVHFSPLTEIRISILARRTPAIFQSLTRVDRELCRLLAEGFGSKEIAARLDVSRKTVDAHRVAIAARLGIDRHKLVAWCGEFHEWF